MTLPASLRPSSNDLWALAAARLSDDNSCNINFSCPDKLKILSEVQSLTEQSRQKCISKRWRYTRKSGETIIFRDLFAKVVKSIDLFKQVGDCAVQYDAVHAALPWAGVRFLLQIAVNDIANFNFAVEGANSIAEMICRYAIFEGLYLGHPSPATEELKRALVQLYAAILTYLSKVKSYFDQNSAKRLAKSGLLPGFDLDHHFQDEQVTIDRCAVLVDAQNLIDNYTELKDLLKKIDGPLNRMSDDLRNVQVYLEASKRTEILRWISSEPYIQHHEETKKDVLSGTGKWLLSDSTFQKWKKESVSSILWLHGIPGSGKSKLVSVVIEDAMKNFHDGCSPLPVFFYCSRNPAEPARSSPKAILASIVRQLSSVEPRLPLLDPAVRTYKEKEAQAFASGALRIEESCALIIQLVEHYPLTTIVVDALDECDPGKRADLLENLETILQQSSNLIKVFVSSRDDQDLVCHLQDYPNLEIASDRNRDDIVAFVRTEVKDLVKKKKLLRYSLAREELMELIIDNVIKGAGGMFRWVSMQLRYLCSKTLDNDIRERLGQLPPDLESLYLELYQNLWKDDGDARHCVIKNVLSWLLCAQETLKSNEFLAVVSVTPTKYFEQVSKDQILDMCCNLVVFDATLDTFRFAHLSVREFLEKRPEYVSTVVNSLAAEICLLGLITAAQTQAAKRFLNQSIYPLMKRSSFSGDQRTSGVLKDMFYFFLCEDLDSASAFAVWESQLDQPLFYRGVYDELHKKLTDARSSSAEPLFVACAFNFSEVVQTYAARQTFRENFRNSKNNTALQIAAVHSSGEVILILLTEKIAGNTEKVVMAAAKYGKKETMMLLLEQRGQEIKITERIVEAAARNWRSGKEIMLLLLEQRGQEITITEKIVEAAAMKDEKEIMMLLLEQRGQEIKITEKIIKAAAMNTDEGGTALHIAVYEGHCSMIQMLLNNKVDLNIKDSHGWTPYMIALTCGRDSICRLLLQYGCEKLDLENTIGFHPSGLIKTVTTSKAIISDHDFIVKTELMRTYELPHRIQTRANHPVPAGSRNFYFEVTVLNGVKSLVSVGICGNRFNRMRMPGRSPGFWLYLNNGKKITEILRSSAYGPVYGTGDVVGCGTDSQTGNVFFTKNGENLGTAFTHIKDRLFPVIGIVGEDAQVCVNFGQSEFIFKGL